MLCVPTHQHKRNNTRNFLWEILEGHADIIAVIMISDVLSNNSPLAVGCCETRMGYCEPKKSQKWAENERKNTYGNKKIPKFRAAPSAAATI